MTDQHPPDVVPRHGLTVEALDALASGIGPADVEISEPGAVLLDVDGLPAGVAAPTRTRAALAAVVITRRELDQLGVTPDDAARRWPRLRVVEP
jgi:hypothetical protein